MDEWLSTQEAMQRLGRSERQIRNYATAGRLRQRKRNGRVQYAAADVEALRLEIRPERSAPVELVPAQNDERIADLQAQLNATLQEIGRLRGLLEAERLQLTEARQAAALLVDREREAARLEAELNAARTTGGTLRRLLWLLAALLAVAVVVVVILAMR